MKYLATAILLVAIAGSAHAGDHFKEWCEAFTAQELVSLAANRMFGPISTLDDAAYKKRSAWVNDAYKIAEQRFTQRTGQKFSGYEFKQKGNWVARCQLADQIR